MHRPDGGPAGSAPLSRRLRGVLLAAALAAVLIVIGMMLPDGARHTYVVEGGILEDLTVAAYAALIFSLVAASGADRKFFISSAAIAALALARELDLHNRTVTTWHVFKLRSYTGGTVPLAEKLVVGAVLLVLALFLLWYAVTYARGLWRKLREGDPAGYGIVTGFLLLVLAKIFDLLVRTVRELTGIALEPGVALKVAEESFELVAPLVFLWALLQQKPAAIPSLMSRMSRRGAKAAKTSN